MTDHSAGNRNKEQNRKRRSGSGFRRAEVLIVLALLLLALSAAAVWSALVLHEPVIFPNVVIGTAEVGGLSREEALAAVTEQGWTEENIADLTLRTYGGISVQIDPVKAGVYMDAEEAVEEAWQVGRDGGFLSRLKTYIRCRSEGYRIDPSDTVIHTDYLEEKIALLAAQIDELLTEREMVTDTGAGEVIVYKAGGGVRLDTAGAADRITEAFDRGKNELFLGDLTEELTCPDFSLLSDMLRREAADARFTDDGTFTVVPDQTGVYLDPVLAAALWEQAEPGAEIRVPLEITLPEVRTEDLEGLLYRDLLGAVTTKYNDSGENRCSNVRLAAQMIDGTVVYPGQEFSFNETVGERTRERGFLPAPAYAGYDNVTGEIGGGVCQVSTGIYAAALYSFLEITEHTCHVHPPNYIQVGTDTAVTIPEGGGRTIDFRFLNTKAYPVRITAFCEETVTDGRPLKTITVEIWGTLEAGDYMPVEFDNTYSDIYDYDRIIDPAYSDREGYRIKLTHDEVGFKDDTGEGIRTLTHRKVYDSRGVLVEDKIINRRYSEGFAMDTYYYMN